MRMQHTLISVRRLWLERGRQHARLGRAAHLFLQCSRTVDLTTEKERVVVHFFYSRMASFAGADIRLLRDILLRQQTQTPDTFQVLGTVLPRVRSLHDVLGRVLNVWDLYRSDLLELNAMLCVANTDMFSQVMEEETYDSTSWKVERFGHETLLPLRQLGLTARLCCVGLVSRPSEILRLLDELQDIVVFLRHELLPAVRRFEPWCRLMTSCELSLEACCQTGFSGWPDHVETYCSYITSFRCCNQTCRLSSCSWTRWRMGKGVYIFAMRERQRSLHARCVREALSAARRIFCRLHERNVSEARMRRRVRLVSTL